MWKYALYIISFLAIFIVLASCSSSKIEVPTNETLAADSYCPDHSISKQSLLTRKIGSIIANPELYDRQEITVIGYYRGWDLLNEVNISPPVAPSDWVLKDETGAIYVTTTLGIELPDGLYPDSLRDTNIILEVRGVVRITAG